MVLMFCLLIHQIIYTRVAKYINESYYKHIQIKGKHCYTHPYQGKPICYTKGASLSDILLYMVSEKEHHHANIIIFEKVYEMIPNKKKTKKKIMEKKKFCPI